MSLLPPPPKNDKISSAFSYNFKSALTGVSGSGKSMSAKEELVEIALRTKDDILILDPESEVRHEVA